MCLHVRIQQARVSGRDSEPDRGGFFAQLAHSGYATASQDQVLSILRTAEGCMKPHQRRCVLLIFERVAVKILLHWPIGAWASEPIRANFFGLG